MDLKIQKKLVQINKELATATQWQPSHRCKQSILLAKQLASVTTLYAEILESVIRKEIRQSYARRIFAIIIEIVKSYTKVS